MNADRHLTISRPSHDFTVLAGGLLAAFAVALALTSGILAGVDTRVALAVAAGSIYVALALRGLAAAVAAWTVALFIPFYAVGNAMLKAGLALSAVALLGWSLRHRRSLWGRLCRVAPVMCALSAFLAWLTISILWATDRASAISELWKYGISVGAFVAVAVAIDTDKQTRLLIAGFVAGAAITSVGALVGYSGGTVNALPGAGRLQGGTGDPNVLGAATLAGLILAGGLLTCARRNTARAVLLATIVLLGATAVGSQSRGDAVSVVVALVASLLIMRGRRRAVLALIFVAAVASSVWFASSPGALQHLTSASSRGDGRYDLWHVAWLMVQSHPLLGVGLANYVTQAPNYVLQPGSLLFIHLIIEQPVVVHNTYLQFLAETGLVGLLLFMSIVSVALTACLRAASAYEARGRFELAHLARCVFVAGLALLVAGFFFSAGVDYKMWLVLGLGPCMLADARRKPSTTVDSGREAEHSGASLDVQ